MKLRYGYLISGVVTGIILLVVFISTLPDGRLHLIFCDVGQGDALYVRFPDGKDMLIDGGPNNKVLQCLGRYMPFWDRHIDLVVLTHPQKDHMQGIIAVLQRYSIGYLLRSDVAHTSQGFAELENIIKQHAVSVRYLKQGDDIRVGEVTMSTLWPSDEQLAKGQRVSELTFEQSESGQSRVLGAVSGDLNDYSLVMHMKHGVFDALFTGDADSRIDAGYVGSITFADGLDVLKVPHHGSKTGMSQAFAQWARPFAAIVSVGKNSYGHPSESAMKQLSELGSTVYRTDTLGDIVVISDGKRFTVGGK